MKPISFVFLSLLTGTALEAQAQQANIQAVQDAYAKFGAGDIPGVISYLAPEVEMSHVGDPGSIPFAGVFMGHAEVGRFFQIVGESVQVTRFEPTNFRTEGNKVINDVHIEGILVPTGKQYYDLVTMTWTFRPDGKILYWDITGDMKGIIAASQK